jgi:DNA-binding NarL/FixJ family response regulator
MMMQHSSTRKRVVIVDDSRTMQAILEQMLSARSGFEIVGIAADGESALTMIRTLKPDLVTIDLMMPYIDGAQLLSELRPYTEMRKVIISATAAKSLALIARLEGLGADACICKNEISQDPEGFIRSLSAIITKPRRIKSGSSSAPSHKPSLPTSPYPIPTDENDRIATLKKIGIANDIFDRKFDLLTEHLATTTRFAACIMTFIDHDKQWVKSGYNFERMSMARSQAICNYTLCGDTAFIVSDTFSDARFSELDVVKSGAIRSYVGQPIVGSDGVRLGAICLLDSKPKNINLEELRNLRSIAKIAASIIDDWTQPVKSVA